MCSVYMLQEDKRRKREGNRIIPNIKTIRIIGKLEKEAYFADSPKTAIKLKEKEKVLPTLS